MRRLPRPAAVLPALLLTAALTSTAAATTTGGCTVTPNPDPVGTWYTVTATGLQPGVWYVDSGTEPGIPTAYGEYDNLVQADSSGTASITLGWGDARGNWVPGTVTERWARASGRGYNTTGGEVAACSFQVVAPQ